MYAFPSLFGVNNSAYSNAYASPYNSFANANAQSSSLGFPSSSYAFPSFGSTFPSLYNSPQQSIANAYGAALQTGGSQNIQSNLWGQAASGSYAHGAANGVDTQALTLSSPSYQLALAIARSQSSLAWSLAANTPYGNVADSFAMTPQGFYVNGQPYQGQNLGYDPFSLLQGRV